jgi:hypothetical protein
VEAVFADIGRIAEEEAVGRLLQQHGRPVPREKAVRYQSIKYTGHRYSPVQQETQLTINQSIVVVIIIHLLCSSFVDLHQTDADTGVFDVN